MRGLHVSKPAEQAFQAHRCWAIIHQNPPATHRRIIYASAFQTEIGLKYAPPAHWFVCYITALTVKDRPALLEYSIVSAIVYNNLA